MDVTALGTLAAKIVSFVIPFLPHLKPAGEKAVERVGEEFGSDAWDLAKRIWAKVWPGANASASAAEAVDDAVRSPDDPDVQAALRIQIKKILSANPNIANEVGQLMDDRTTQRVIADHASQIRRVKQSSTSGGNVDQEVVAKQESVIEDVQQDVK